MLTNTNTLFVRTWRLHVPRWRHCSVSPHRTIRLRNPQLVHRPTATYAFYIQQNIPHCVLSLRKTTHVTHTDLCPGLPRWAGTKKAKPIWILLKQETVSGSGMSWAICKSAPRSRQITTPAPHHSVFTGRKPFLPPNQQRQSTEGNYTRLTVSKKTLAELVQQSLCTR